MIICSLAGEVRLWDARGSERAAYALDPQPAGLSCFDVHPQTGLFATCVNVFSVGFSLGNIE
jgi:regulator-associated protein of mTOR